MYEHDFITILGGNGAGKSTLFNVIAGTLKLSEGHIKILGKDVTSFGPERRANYLSRVFQDPENGNGSAHDSSRKLTDCGKTGTKAKTSFAVHENRDAQFTQLLSRTGNGLENHLQTPTGLYQEDNVKL
ncbi:ATP-binding cassette domain-containing protein [Streptococcus iniae]